MYNKKSDFRKFCETMWVIAKYDVLPWMIGAGLFAAFVFELQDAKANGKVFVKETAPSFFQKQR